MSSQWSQQRERGSAFLILLIKWIALSLGRNVARIILYPITAYFLITARVAVNSSREFFRITGLAKPTLFNAARHIHCFSATILDRVFFLTGRFDQFDIQIHGIDHVYNHVTEHSGCILLGSHHGSFEVLRAMNVKKHKIPLKALMYPNHNAFMNQVLESLNPAIKDSVIPLGQPDTMIQAMEFYQQGHITSILADRATREDKSVKCAFFGSNIKIPSGPFQLALALKAPVIQFFGIYHGGNRYDIHFELITSEASCDRSKRQKTIEQLAQQYTSTLEKYVISAPFNWFNFYPYWR